MEKMRLGRTGILASRTAFGALPIQRTEMDEAIRILRRAYDGGVNFFDTARGYTDSEEKLGRALSDVREDIFIATKSMAPNGKALLENCEASLRTLKTDHIDVYQLHNPPSVPREGDELYETMFEIKKSGKARAIGITCHKLGNAAEAAKSGLYDTVQFPLSYLSSPEELDITRLCAEKDIGFIAMKALSGGLVSSAPAAFAFLRQLGNVLPIWGMQRMEELEEFLAMEKSPPALAGELQGVIDRDLRELSGTFCRGCGYCLPCPAEIPIWMAARMSLLLKRAPWRTYTTKEWRGSMDKIDSCTNCGHCKRHCPYGLDTPELLKRNLADYRAFCGELGPEL